MASIKHIVGYYRDYWLVTLFTVTMSSLFEIIDLFSPYAMGQILNVLSGQSVDYPVQKAADWLGGWWQRPGDRVMILAVLLGAIFLLSVVRAPIQPWIGHWFFWDTSFRARRIHQEKSLKKILTLPLEFYDENNPGRIAGRIARGLSNHTWTYPEIIGQLIPKLMRVTGIFIIIWLVEWRIALLFVLSFVVILSFSINNLTQIMVEEELIDRYAEDTESRNSEIVTNIKTIKAFATETDELERQRTRWDREFKVLNYRVHKGYVLLNTWHRTIVQTCVFTVLALTLWATVQGRISLGHFITTLTIANMAYSELEPISNLAEVFARRYSAMIRFHDLMHQRDGLDAVEFNSPKALAPYQFTGKIELQHLTFGYDPARPVLRDLNLLIYPRQTVALVGRSGSGKSTLVKLLFRYFEPNDGAILMDGDDIRSLDVSRYRKRLAIVHQEVDIFNGTVLDNLTYGNPNASLEQVMEACEIARADEFIRQLPNGYKTIVGERGMRLSGGQRQRVGIARALLVNPDVLVFDEATSSLDYESERAIQLAMRSILGTRTTIIIAHRLSTVREADVIVVLDKGQIVEVGNHSELLAHRGIYHCLHTLQETGELLT
ncbi:MAG: ABC transporter ATP-binding protein/permease [Cyanobacteria bacterium]|nr:ABC transporter ATP-binding protein/permease [Cyanobacteriota bacterium]MDW8201196.1 ABC transporter ATP-binding protein [Cyanobacteriota bacterium SKYGB_h_bin112]